MDSGRKIILVLGPHRSGTSLCAAAVQALGAELALPADYANEENRKGFFEHPSIVEFNDRLLAHLGGVWDNPLFDGPSRLASTTLGDWQASAKGLVEQCYGKAPVIAIKDPRLCQLLSFWLAVFRSADIEERAIQLIHVHRHPAEVAYSQKIRAERNKAFYEFGQELAEGAALWLSLNAQALAQAQGLKTCFLSYSELLRRPHEALERLSAFLELRAEDAAIAHFAERFVDPSLHRSAASPEIQQAIFSAVPAVNEANAILDQLCEQPQPSGPLVSRLLSLYARSETHLSLIQATSPALSRLSSRCRQQGLESKRNSEIIVELNNQHSQMQAELNNQHSQMQAEINSLRKKLTALIEQRDTERAEHQSQLRTEREAKEQERRAYQAELQAARSTIDHLDARVKDMEHSTSWRLTAPIRQLRMAQRKLTGQALQTLARAHLRGVHLYSRLSLHHPHLAWRLRVMLRPLIRPIKPYITAARSLPPQKADSPVSQALSFQQQKTTSASFQPLVSIIVPNFNHADYLEQRLESIYNQTYNNIEVILLDDGSKDDSVSILKRYQEVNAEQTRLVLNEENSGGVFFQWEKGLNAANGALVWIAESDDWCDLDFLETLVPLLANEAVQLAYCHTTFIDAATLTPQWSLREYLHDIDPERWRNPFIETAHQLVSQAFAYKNIVPNVSSAVFRNPKALEILDDPDWKRMRLCGDWVFYLHVIRGGLIAYSPHTENYYRMHDRNTSVSEYFGDDYYSEHEKVASVVQHYYKVSPEVFETQRNTLIAHWRQGPRKWSEEVFNRCYSLARIEAQARHRKPNLLMVSYGFCTGGGETFPVELANLMKGTGYGVTFLDCAQTLRNEGLRRRLRPDIPVISDLADLRRIIAEFGIDLVHSHHAWVDNSILSLLPEDKGCATVITLHGMYETMNDAELSGLLPTIAERTDHLIYVAEKNLLALKNYRLFDPSKLTQIENALPKTAFEPVSRQALAIEEDAFVLALVSRGMPEKGWQEAIEIVTRTRAETDQAIDLVLVGDGQEYERLSTTSLPEFIHLAGFQENVRGFFALSDLGLLPSRFRGESAPLVIIECLQAGKPLIASDLGEIRRMLDSRQGLAGEVIELKDNAIDIDCWVNTLSELVRHREKYAELVSRVPAAAMKFDPTIMAQRHDQAYKAALAKAGIWQQQAA